VLVSFGNVPIDKAIELAKMPLSFFGVLSRTSQAKVREGVQAFLYDCKEKLLWGSLGSPLLSENRLRVKGLEAIRRDACPLVKNVQ